MPLEPGPVPAAVLVPLFFKDGEFHLLFTKRTSRLAHHSGEISFPGGRREPEDVDCAATALRETWEEIGIPAEEIQVLGELDDTKSVYNYLVTPVVGVIPADYPLTVNDDEIERLIVAPLAHFWEPGVFRTEQWQWEGRTRPVYFYQHGDDEIWGLTARILKQFLEIVNGEEHPPEPDFHDEVEEEPSLNE